MAQTTEIESKFIFNHKPDNVSYISDNEGHRLGFNTLPNGNNIVFTKDLEGIDVAIEHQADGTKIFHMEKDSKGLPAMHEFKPDGTEIIYLFDATRRLEKMIEMKTNGDKVTYWFSAKGETITQEQRQKGGIVFKMKNESTESLIWLQVDGSIQVTGDKKLNLHLKKVFSSFLDGVEIN